MKKPQDLQAKLKKIGKPSISIPVLSILVIIIGLTGGLGIAIFSQTQESRELMQWQNKLNLIAASRAAEVEKYLTDHFKELEAIAKNPSLQLYLSTLLNTPTNQTPPALTEEPAQAVFLRNILLMTANKLGFITPQAQEIKEIRASLPNDSGTGIAIINNEGQIIVSTAGLTNLSPDLAEKLEKTPKGQPSLIDIETTTEGTQVIGFTVPIYSIQSDEKAESQIGRLVGIKKIGSALTTLLKHPDATDATLEALLLRQDKENVIILSSSDTNRKTTTYSLSSPHLDAAYAMTKTGNFAVKRTDSYLKSLMTSRPINSAPYGTAPWVLMLHINRDEAMADSDRFRAQTEIALIASIAAVIAFVIAAWYYGTSRRIWKLTMEAADLNKKISAREKLLRVVADNQIEPILLVDTNDIIHFANDTAGKIYRLPPTDMLNKDLAALMGAGFASEYSDANKTARVMGEPHKRTWNRPHPSNNTATPPTEATTQIIRSLHIPLTELPIDYLPNDTQGTLVIDQDITDVVKEREKRLELSHKLIDALVDMVDKRDHNAAHHSEAVAYLAREISRAMNLDNLTTETAETAGKLMNLGKIVVPPELLTKPTPLAEEERSFIRDSIQRSADVIQSIPFEGPVCATLRQAQERYDGEGNETLKGDSILITARIIAVANAFVGLISPRPYRPKSSMTQAIRILMQEIEKQYDPRVVVTLAHLLENEKGKETLAHLIARIG